MSNKLNNISKDFREFLLNRNFISETIKKNGLDSLLNDIGKEISINNNSKINTNTSNNEFYRELNIIENLYNTDRTRINSNISNNEFYRELNTIENLYNTDGSNTIDIDNSKLSDVYGKRSNYLDEYGNLRGVNTQNNLINIIGSITQGGTIGINPTDNTLVSDFDVRSSLIGRTLSNTGLINDTRLGIESSKWLLYSITNNIASNIQEETIGRINTNSVNLLNGGNIVTPNYKITVKSGKLGVGFDLLERMIGFKTPISLLSREASIFNNENPISNILRGNNIIKNTGKGQILALFDNINRNLEVNNNDNTLRSGYSPNYYDRRVGKGINKNESTEGNYQLYAYDDGTGGVIDFINGDNANPISYSNYNREDTNSEFNRDVSKFEYPHINNNDIGFTWTDKSDNKDINQAIPQINVNDRRTLLYKTDKLFKTNKIKTLTIGKGVKAQQSSIQSSVYNGYASKGSAVLGEEYYKGSTDPNKIFCRTHNLDDRYDRYTKLIKHDKLKNSPVNDGGSGNIDFSVLDDNGMVKIAPYIDDKQDIKKYMFSIENLAWLDESHNLLECEKGPNGGRIMWFPPYELTFSESVSVNFERHEFIGRGEPIFTYNNTDRTGSLSWKIIIDHPNEINYLDKSFTDEELNSYLAGCIDGRFSNVLTDSEKDEIKKLLNNTKKVETNNNNKIPDVKITYYFPNDSSAILSGYEDGLDENGVENISYSGGGLGITYGDGIVGIVNKPYIDNTDFGLNGFSQEIKIGDKTYKGPFDVLLNIDLIEYLNNECRYCKIKIEGYSSQQGNIELSEFVNEENNKKLSEARANSVKNYLLSNILASVEDGEKRISEVNGNGVINTGCLPNMSQDTKECKEARKVEVTIYYDPEYENENTINNTIEDSDTKIPRDLGNKIRRRLYTECEHFNRYSDDFILKLREKIKYFHPSFHSITPEGFNSRLTFLHQCTRQGPTRNNDENPNNLAFGRPPICILRVGDFYNTKIVIDSLSIDYEQVWDLNPEGIGVQPMIANVSITFSFIGGSSLKNAISKLQNAVSFNYFANTELYDFRADYYDVNGNLVKGKDLKTLTKNIINNDKSNVNEYERSQVAEAENENNKLENTQ